MLEVFRDPVRELRRLYAEGGPITSLMDEGREHLFVFGAELNRAVLSQPDLFEASEDDSLPFSSPSESPLRRLCRGLLYVNGPDHKEQRRAVVDAIGPRHLPRYGDLISRVAAERVGRWPVGEEIDLHRELSETCFRVSLAVVFGLDPDSEEGVHVGGLLKDFTGRIFDTSGVPPADADADGLSASTVQLAERLERELVRLFQDARTDTPAAGMLPWFAHMGNLPGDAGERAAQMLTLFIAGHESTASALAWLLFLLIQHPVILAELLEEIENAPTDDVSELELFDGAVKESLRLFPPGLWGLRTAAEDTVLGGRHVPAGTRVVYSPFITHRIESIYPHPSRFDPYRWRTMRPSPYEFMPFGAGPRMCVGVGLATLEVKLIAAMVLRRFRLSMAPGCVINRGARAAPGAKLLPVTLHHQDHAFVRVPVGGNVHELVDFPAD